MNEGLSALAILVGIAHSGLRLATPYLYAAIGETFAQRSGVLNLGVEGIMLMGAFSGFYATFVTGSPLLGLLVAIAVGGLMGLAMAFVSVTLKAEQGISGIGFYLFAVDQTARPHKPLLVPDDRTQWTEEPLSKVEHMDHHLVDRPAAHVLPVFPQAVRASAADAEERRDRSS